MSNDRDFPQALVDERAKELYRAANPHALWETQWSGTLDAWRAAARLSLSREREACAPLVEALEVASRRLTDVRSWACVGYVDNALAAHRARYAPEPPKPTLAEAVERLIAALGREDFEQAFADTKAALARERAK